MRYKRFCFLIGLLALVAGSVGQAWADENRPWLVALYLNHGSFDTSDIDADGRQTIGYAQVVYDRDKWGLGLTSAYVQTKYKTQSSAERLDISGLTNTTITSFYKTSLGGWNLRFGLDVATPTGKTDKSVEELGMEMADDVRDDLLLMNSYGRGLDLAPHISATLKSGPVTWGLGGRYTLAGEYDPTSNAANDNFDPGDNLKAVGSVMLRFRTRNSILLTFMYSTSGEDKQSGKSVFRNGDIYTLETRLVRNWSNELTSTLAFVHNRQTKNKRLAQGAALVSELNNSNVNTTDIFAQNAYVYDRRLTITLVGGYRVAASNGYGEGDTFYDAGRKKVYLEPGVIWSFSESYYSTFRLRYSHVNDKKDAFSSTDAAYQVFRIDTGVVFSF